MRQMPFSIFPRDDDADPAPTADATPPPSASPHAPDVTWTVREFFERYYLPRVAHHPSITASAGTVAELRCSVNQLDRFTGARLGHFASEADADRVLCAFLEALAHKGTGANTQRKHLTHIGRILSFAGTRKGRLRALAAKVPGIPESVDLPKPRQTKSTKTRMAWNAAEIAQIIAHADAANRPRFRSITTADYHRELWRFLWATACRIGEALTLEFCDVDFREPRWYLPDHKAKKHHAREVWLPPAATEVLERMRGVAAEAGCARPFPWPALPVRAHVNSLHRQANKIIAAAIKAGRLPPACGDWPHHHAARRGALLELAASDQRAATLIAGHADPQTTLAYIEGRRDDDPQKAAQNNRHPLAS